ACNTQSASVNPLGVDRPFQALVDDTEIVERIRQVRVHRTDVLFLHLGGKPELLLGRDEIAGARRLFCGARQILKVRYRGHWPTLGACLIYGASLSSGKLFERSPW